MKRPTQLIVFVTILMVSVNSICAFAENDIIVADELANCTPYAAEIRAYDPNGHFDEPIGFSTVPEEIDLGVVNEDTPWFSATIDLFNHLKLTPYVGDRFPSDTYWHFSVDYTVLDQSKNPSTLRLDFYDYSELVGFTWLSLPGESGETIFVSMPLEDILSFEDIYINLVARLKRIPEEE